MHSPLRSGARGAVASPAASSTSWSTALDGTGRPGILARRPYHGCGFALDCGSGGSRLWWHGNPSTLPSWTHEDTSLHARERDRSPEERRPRRLTAAMMRLI